MKGDKEMEIRSEYIKFKKYRMDMKLAAVYVARVMNEDVPMGEQQAVIKEFLKDLAEQIKTKVAIPQM